MTTQKGFDTVETQQQRARRNGGATAHLRSVEVLTPRERWEKAVPDILARFREFMDGFYTDMPPAQEDE